MEEEKLREVIDALNKKLEDIENGIPVDTMETNTLESKVSALVISLPIETPLPQVKITPLSKQEQIEAQTFDEYADAKVLPLERTMTKPDTVSEEAANFVINELIQPLTLANLDNVLQFYIRHERIATEGTGNNCFFNSLVTEKYLSKDRSGNLIIPVSIVPGSAAEKEIEEDRLTAAQELYKEKLYDNDPGGFKEPTQILNIKPKVDNPVYESVADLVTKGEQVSSEAFIPRVKFNPFIYKSPGVLVLSLNDKSRTLYKLFFRHYDKNNLATASYAGGDHVVARGDDFTGMALLKALFDMQLSINDYDLKARTFPCMILYIPGADGDGGHYTRISPKMKPVEGHLGYEGLRWAVNMFESM
jgi:hypothetical protein